MRVGTRYSFLVHGRPATIGRHVMAQQKTHQPYQDFTQYYFYLLVHIVFAR
jgi:hypothetical protein